MNRPEKRVRNPTRRSSNDSIHNLRMTGTGPGINDANDINRIQSGGKIDVRLPSRQRSHSCRLGAAHEPAQIVADATVKSLRARNRAIGLHFHDPA